MKSPFPGMDPYLERHWGDVHTSLVVYARNQINPQLPDDLQARVEESVTVLAENTANRTLYPDVRVVEESEGTTGNGTQSVATIPVATPCVLALDEPQTERHVEIVDSVGRVVTALEFLSPANKVGHDGKSAYTRKKRDYLEGGVNLVEINLVREGEFALPVPQERIPADYRTPYSICIRRATRIDQVELYRAPLRETLPNIPIPLRPADKDVVLQLQPLIDACYHDGRYGSINYKVEAIPRLEEDDTRWADQLLREKGLR